MRIGSIFFTMTLIMAASRKIHSVLTRLRRVLSPLASIISGTIREFFEDQCLIRAASLSFSTLLAGVPLMAFLLSLFTAFGAFREVVTEVQNFIIDMLMPTKQEELILIIEEFVGNSRALGVAGLALFAITSLNLLNTITVNLNALWTSRYRANFLRKFTTYTSVLIFGTLLISASFTLRSFMAPIFSPLQHPVWSFILFVTPTLLMFVTFLLLILLVPSAKIRPRYAVVGSAVGVVFWELAKVAFVEGTNYVIRASVMYGSMAAIIIFLFWLYIVWIIILAASELTYTLQNRLRPWSGIPVPHMAPSGRVFMGLKLFFIIAEEFHHRRPPLSTGELAGRLGISLQDAEYLCGIFLDEGYLHEVEKEETTFVPACSPEALRMGDLVEVLIGRWPGQVSEDEPVLPLLNRVKEGLHDAMGETTLGDLLKEVAPRADKEGKEEETGED